MRSGLPLVSVIIPTYDRSELLQVAVESALAQMAALPRYALSAMLRQARLVAGRATP